MEEKYADKKDAEEKKQELPAHSPAHPPAQDKPPAHPPAQDKPRDRLAVECCDIECGFEPASKNGCIKLLCDCIGCWMCILGQLIQGECKIIFQFLVSFVVIGLGSWIVAEEGTSVRHCQTFVDERRYVCFDNLSGLSLYSFGVWLIVAAIELFLVFLFQLWKPWLCGSNSDQSCINCQPSPNCRVLLFNIFLCLVHFGFLFMTVYFGTLYVHCPFQNSHCVSRAKDSVPFGMSLTMVVLVPLYWLYKRLR
jgi:hypothetical protein